MTRSYLTLSLSRVVRIVLLLAVVAGTVGFVAFQKTVTVSVDGKQQTVHTFASTVGDMLERQGLTVGAHDVVSPSEASPVTDGSTVALRYGRLLDLTVDGKQREVWVTAHSVDEALHQLGMRTDGAYVSASRSMPIGRSGLVLSMRTPKAVTIAADGKTSTVTTTAVTVGDALKQANVTLGSADVVAPTVGTLLTGDVNVSVTRVVHEDMTETVAIPNATETRQDSSLYKDQTKVVQQGKPGAKTIKYTLVKYDGKVAYRIEGGEAVTQAPVAEIKAQGTRTRPSGGGSTGGSSGGGGAVAPPAGAGVWDQLAQCESGGNWAINTGNGYYGGLQFSLGTWLAYGGGSYAHLPSEASRSAQIAVAEKLRATSGYYPWPACSRKLGLI